MTLRAEGNLFWNLEPLVSVGPIRFGMPIGEVIARFGAHLVPLEYHMGVFDGSDTYELPFCETQVYVEDGVVEGVGCFDELFYCGKNLFGLSLDEIRELLGPEDEFSFEGEGRSCMEYEQLGAQVWFDHDGFVDSVMCGGLIEEDDPGEVE